MTDALSFAPAAAAVAAAAAAAAPVDDAPLPIDIALLANEIAAEASAVQLRLLATRWREQEGVARTPFVVLQALALARQFEQIQAPPTDEGQRQVYRKAMCLHGSGDKRGQLRAGEVALLCVIGR